MLKSDLEKDERDDAAKKLVKRIQKSDDEAIKEFFELYSDEIYNFPIKFYNFSDDEAGDLYLYAFEHLKDGNKLSSFKGKSKFSTWFHSVLRNLTIDFLRTQREKLRTTTTLGVDSKGNVIDALTFVAEQSHKDSFEQELFQSFQAQLLDLKLPQRVLFKLAYIHYLDLDAEEIDWLCETNKKSPQEIMEKVMELKDIVLEKEGDVRHVEDKLTANFQHIMVLEEKINAYFKDHPELRIERDAFSEDFHHPDVNGQIVEAIHSLAKKKKKQMNLINQQKKGLLSVRVPYKEISELVGSSKGVLSVQLLRIVEKLNQGIENS